MTSDSRTEKIFSNVGHLEVKVRENCLVFEITLGSHYEALVLGEDIAERLKAGQSFTYTCSDFKADS